MGLTREDLKELIQSCALIVWKKDVEKGERDEILNKLYLDNEDKIEHLNIFEMKKGNDISDEFFKFREECK